MALPPAGQAWPPAQVRKILPQIGIWSAWYSGSSDQLSAAYGGATGSDPSATGFFASDHGGFRATVGRALTRFFWGEATRGPDRRNKLHIPIAAELCQASADLLFADEVTLKVVGDVATQERLDALSGDGLHSEIAAAAEIAAALGGAYLRVTWDGDLTQEPFITHVDADQAIPEFRWGRLAAVTFWQVVVRDGKHVFRHLERHETNAAGDGVILHGLYMGEEDKLGFQISLMAQPATAGLMPEPDTAGSGTLDGDTLVIDSQSPGLCVEYVRNQTPNRIWRTDPLGRHLGRSDLDGVEPLMDALDEVYSSWMRDIRLGKAKVMVAKTLLDNVGPGNGRAFDMNQELYAPVNTLAGKDQPLSAQMTNVQFNIRVDEHKGTSDELVEQILTLAGYSSQTFGSAGNGRAERTATEVESKERRSMLTRGRKLRLWRPALKRLVLKLLAVDRAIFGTPNNFTDVDVMFANGVQETQLSLAQTAQALRTAQAASTRVLVGLVHPDWEDDMVDAEVELIHTETDATFSPMPPPDFGAPTQPDGQPLPAATQ